VENPEAIPQKEKGGKEKEKEEKGTKAKAKVPLLAVNHLRVKMTAGSAAIG
jgi:hypothetical protein